jgi:hypothetical protein
MRKFMVGLVVLVMFGMCASSYATPLPGLILVYDVTTMGKGIDVNDNNTLVNIPLKAVLVMRFDDTNTLRDANLIMYGIESRAINPQKVYVELDMSDSNAFLSNVSIQQEGKFFVLDLVANDSPFNFEELLLGKAVLLGRNHPVDILAKAKGVIWVRDGMLLDPDQDITGVGDLSMSLRVPYTLVINDSLARWNQDEVVVTGKTILGKHIKGIREALEAKGFQRISPID